MSTAEEEEEEEEEEEVEELWFGEGLSEGTHSEESEAGQREIVQKVLSREEACTYLGLLGKPADALGIEVAYLQITATEKMLTDISVIASFPHVMFVDVSNNLLNEEAFTALKEMKFLVKLQADGNMIASCKLPAFPFLQVLTLNRNRIEIIDGFECPLLECLEITFNRITEIKKLDPPNLSNLKILDLHGNYLESTAGIQCPTLERLYLADNKIRRIEGLEVLENLQILHLRRNPLQILNGFSKSNSSLTYINLRDCPITNIKEIRKLSVLPQLDTLILWDTPVQENMGDGLRTVVLSYIPTLKRINKAPVQAEEVEEAEHRRKQRELLEAEEAEMEEFSDEEGEEEIVKAESEESEETDDEND